jgi:hypothetical protein
MSRASPKCAVRVCPIVGWVERSDTHQLLLGTVMGFASLYPSYEGLSTAIQNCCSVKTVVAIPARSRSSTLCESYTPDTTLSAIRIPRRCRYPSRAKSTATEGLRSCWSIRVRERPKKRRAPMLA